MEIKQITSNQTLIFRMKRTAKNVLLNICKSVELAMQQFWVVTTGKASLFPSVSF